MVEDELYFFKCSGNCSTRDHWSTPFSSGFSLMTIVSTMYVFLKVVCLPNLAGKEHQLRRYVDDESKQTV
jgi:hypothetical protein